MWFKKKKDSKNVYLLLDRSGSMAGEWSATLDSVNGYVQKLEDDVNVYIAAFDSGDDWWRVLRQTTAAKYESLTVTEVSPRGWTSLFDAAGKIMSQMIADNPEKAVLVVMTDGGENSSKEFKHADVMGKLKELENKDWPVVYLGAGFPEVSSYAQSTFAMASGQTYNTTAVNRGATMGLLNTKTSAYFAAGPQGAMGPSGPAGPAGDLMNFTDEEKAELDNKTSG